MYSAETQDDIEDFGIISLMYHRFEENKYPSTNIKILDFKKHLEVIKKNNIKFINPKNFQNELVNNKKQRKVLLTIDDGFLSFYKNAWPILKKNKIPFILFVNTREVGSFNYMSWDQIKEINKEDFVEIGNHSHSHEYLVDENNEFKGKVNSLDLFGKEGKILDADVIEEDCIFIPHNASLQSAMEVASNFIGEIIPIVDTDRNKAVATITEGAIFQAYLSKQNQTVEMEKR